MDVMCLNLRCYAFVAYLMHCCYQVSSQFAFGNTPVYIGEPLTLTCDYGSGVQLQYVTLDAFNGTRKDGFLWCNIIGANTTSVGVFSGRNFNGCPVVPALATSVNVTLSATLSLELDYNCTARVNDGNSFFFVSSGPFSPKFFVLPSPPLIAPSALTFNQSDIATVTCESLNGKPAADILLTVSMPNGPKNTSRSISSCSLVLPSPSMDWHNATATCNVTNHNFPNMTVTRTVMINHVRSTGVPNVMSTSLSTVTLDCSAFVRSYPGVLYSWQASLGTNATVGSYPSNATFDVQPGQWGTFNCTATNIVTMDRVTITFIVSNVTSTTSSYMSTTSTPNNNYLWVIGPILGIAAVVVIAVVLGVLCKRGHFSKGKKKHDVKPTSTDQRSDKANSRDRLLIAAEGIVSQLSQKTLQSVVVVEYSDQMCSLNDIFAKVRQAVPPSSPKFKSVALLLRPAKVGLTISEVDHAVLTASSIQEDKGEKVRGFISRIAEMCIDNHSSARIDILNYTGKAPLRLKQGLTDLLKINVTVSSDFFGVNTQTGPTGGHATVVDTYFDRTKTVEVVYADLEQLSAKPQVQPRKVEEGVLYSEIQRKA